MNILLATDGSKASADAQWLLERIPFKDSLNLTIAHVVVVPSLAHVKREFPSSVDEILEQYQNRGESLLANEITRFQGINGTVEGCLRTGHPADSIIEIAEEKDSELIIIGARGQTPTQQFLLGSVSASVAKHAPCSVLVTRPSEKVKDPNRSFRIVVGVDESDASRKAVDMLSAVPWGDNVEILVVSIIQNELNYGDWDLSLRKSLSDLQKKQHEKCVETAIDQLKESTSRVSGEVLLADSATEELIDTVKRVDADLVVLGHRGMSRLKRFFLGSTCERLLRHAGCSIWINKDS